MISANAFNQGSDEVFFLAEAEAEVATSAEAEAGLEMDIAEVGRSWPQKNIYVYKNRKNIQGRRYGLKFGGQKIQKTLTAGGEIFENYTSKNQVWGTF